MRLEQANGRYVVPAELLGAAPFRAPVQKSQPMHIDCWLRALDYQAGRFPQVPPLGQSDAPWRFNEAELALQIVRVICAPWGPWTEP